ncbi:hypothetical protein F5Y15DRAFT_232547 [Xylariaceae sp. FL0016]|nr:hypothetical protein F5Y15DRAFT_232547 [Xylariaceae sp. FL0016]
MGFWNTPLLLCILHKHAAPLDASAIQGSPRQPPLELALMHQGREMRRRDTDSCQDVTLRLNGRALSFPPPPPSLPMQAATRRVDCHCGWGVVYMTNDAAPAWESP